MDDRHGNDMDERGTLCPGGRRFSKICAGTAGHAAVPVRESARTAEFLLPCRTDTGRLPAPDRVLQYAIGPLQRRQNVLSAGLALRFITHRRHQRIGRHQRAREQLPAGIGLVLPAHRIGLAQ